jgi:hypothetical protein
MSQDVPAAKHQSILQTPGLEELSKQNLYFLETNFFQEGDFFSIV